MYGNTDPYPYPQGYIPVYLQVHVLWVLRVLMGKGTPAGTPIIILQISIYK